MKGLARAFPSPESQNWEVDESLLTRTHMLCVGNRVGLDVNWELCTAISPSFPKSCGELTKEKQ